MPPSMLDRIKREGDTVMVGGQATDAVILVMGPTGAGKSTFLKNVLSKLGYSETLPECSDGLESCTKQLTAYVVQSLPDKLKWSDGRLILVDTPGFDDTSVSDSEILRRISVWLTSSYDAKMKVAGVIYMFPIYPNRITRNDKANLEVFRKLCGDTALGRVYMSTTKWSLLPPGKKGNDIGNAREDQLKENFWKEMLEHGAKLMRLKSEEPGPAMEVLTALLTEYNALAESVKQRHLELQNEIVSRMKAVPATAAGKELRRKLKVLLKEHKKASGDYETRRQKLLNIADQLQALKLPFGERIKSLLGLG